MPSDDNEDCCFKPGSTWNLTGPDGSTQMVCSICGASFSPMDSPPGTRFSAVVDSDGQVKRAFCAGCSAAQRPNEEPVPA